MISHDLPISQVRECDEPEKMLRVLRPLLGRFVEASVLRRGARVLAYTESVQRWLKGSYMAGRHSRDGQPDKVSASWSAAEFPFETAQKTPLHAEAR